METAVRLCLDGSSRELRLASSVLSSSVLSGRLAPPIFHFPFPLATG